MNRHAAIGIICLVPLVGLAMLVLTRATLPLAGYAAALAVHWFGLMALIWRHWSGPPLDWHWPKRWIVVLQGIMLLGVLAAAGAAVLQSPGALWLLPLIALFAVTNGTLEELFWRGVLIPDPTPQSAGIGVAMFVGWHCALLLATGVNVTGGAFGLLGGAFAGGVIWTFARIQSGSVAFSIAGHVSLNLFAFTELAARNL